MRRRSRTRRVLKWVGLVGCGLLLAAFVATRWWAFAYVVNGWGVCFDRSVIAFGHLTASSSFLRAEIDSPIVVWRPVWIARSVTYGFVSLWVPLLLLAPVTAFLWYSDRRYPTGHCQACGYNLTGNVTGVCPEMG